MMRVGMQLRRQVHLALVVAAALVAAAAQAPDAAPADVDSVLAREGARLDSLLSPDSSIPQRPELESRITALDNGNFDSLGVPFRGRVGLRISPTPGRWSTHNRVEGTRIGAGLDVRFGRRLRFDGNGGYATAAHRWVGQAGLEAGGRHSGILVRLEGMDRMLTFGPTPVEAGTALPASVAGQDRRDYLRRRQAGVWVSPVRSGDGEISLGGWLRDDRSARAMTESHLVGGGTPMEAPNPAVDDIESRGVSACGDWKWRGDLLRLEGNIDHAITTEGGTSPVPDDSDYTAASLALTVRPVVPGGTISLGVEGRTVSGSTPIQGEPYLGGDGNLRGYDRLEFTGRRRLAARIEYECGIDLLARARIPILGRLQLQLIPFVDIGTTWGEGRGATSTRERTLDGEARASFGLGLRRDVWLPGIRAVRLDAIRRADGSREADAVQFWLRFLAYDGS